jgi:hypothetical protein
MMANIILRCLAQIRAAARFFLQRHRASAKTPPPGAAALDAGIVATTSIRLDVNDDPEAGIIATDPVRLDVNDDPEAGIIATGPVRLDVSDEADAGIDPIAHPVADQQEIERRRNLVRLLFNDFWSGIDDKPTAFVDRLNQAEDYLNERLAANGEFWRLDAETRVMLGLPPRSNPPDRERHDQGGRRSPIP